jgi:hypothetical protein
MQDNWACAVITPGEGLAYAFLAEGRAANTSNTISGPWCFPVERVREGEEASAALHRLLHDRFSLGYSHARPLTPREHNGQNYFPFVCALAGSRDFRLDGYLAIRLDTAEHLRALPWDEPFGKILEDF